MIYEVVVKRVAGAAWVEGSYADLHSAVAARAHTVGRYRQTGFVGKRNAAGVYRLSARRDGKRVRLAVFVRQVAYLN